MTVEQAVIDLIIKYVSNGIRSIPIHEVEQAHPKHQLSGRARLRGLRLRGLVAYHHNDKTNTYVIESSLGQLEHARREIMNPSSSSSMPRVSVQKRPPLHGLPSPAPRSAGTAKRAESEAQVDDGRDTDPAFLEEMRKFREAL